MSLAHTFYRGLSALLFAVAGTAALAQDAPTGRVILEVAGTIARTNADGVMQYDLAMLDALPQTEVVTETPWIPSEVSFRGVLVRDLLADVMANGDFVAAAALNDYTVTIPIRDFTDHDVILATRLDGKTLTVRDRGPVWIIYPWSDNPELQNEVYYSRSIWQLKTLTVGAY